MLENPETNATINQENEASTKPLDTVVHTLIKNQSKTKFDLKQAKTYDALFKDIKQVLSEFDTSIGDCKKYNEAKIHRKYEIRIADLENQIKILREKLKQQQNARSPSKKYIEDLVDQLVFYKNQNEKLTEQIEKLTKSFQQFQEKSALVKIQNSLTSLNPSQKQMSPQKVSARETELIESSSQQFNLKYDVQYFLKHRRQLRKASQQPKSKFQNFLKKNIQNCQQWTFHEFLNEIDKWHIKLNANQQNSLERLRSNVMSTFQDEIEKKKFPKISTPYSVPKSLPYVFLNNTQVRKKNKNKESHKSRHHYSTIEVVEKVRQKYTLK